MENTFLCTFGGLPVNTNSTIWDASLLCHTIHRSYAFIMHDFLHAKHQVLLNQIEIPFPHLNFNKTKIMVMPHLVKKAPTRAGTSIK